VSKVSSEEIVGVIKGLELEINVDNLLYDKDLSLQDIDSLDQMRLLFALEEKYHITIDDESLKEREWSSIDKITQRINFMLQSTGI
jgi:acyl carrier protein